MKDRVVIEGEPGEYYLQWYLAAESDMGGILGQDDCTEASLLKASGEEWESVATALEARSAASLTNGERCKRGGSLLHDAFVWERRSDAAAALKLIKAGVAARKAQRPMPEWARTAIANGWKPPKGWTP